MPVSPGLIMSVVMKSRPRLHGYAWVVVGVDTDGDGEIDEWTDWVEVSESYGRIDGFAKAFSVDPAAMDLTGLPDGYGIQFMYRVGDTEAPIDSVVIESAAVVPEPNAFMALGLGCWLCLLRH